MSFTSTPKMGQGTKLLIEMGPLVCFFAANWKAGIFWGTGIFMVATVVALTASWLLTRKLAMVPLVPPTATLCGAALNKSARRLARRI